MNEGIRTYRLAGNPLERLFANAWVELNRDDRMLKRILAVDPNDHRNLPVISGPTNEIVATLIQWLGTPVGQSFLVNVLLQDADMRKRLEPDAHPD